MAAAVGDAGQGEDDDDDGRTILRNLPVTEREREREKSK